MKIRPSLRLYVAVAVLLTGTITVIILSALGNRYYNYGKDSLLHESMVNLAFNKPTPSAQYFASSQIYITNRWQEIPVSIRQQFPEPNLQDQVLLKKIVDRAWFRPPQESYFAMKVVIADGTERYLGLYLEDSGRTLLKRNRLPHVFIILFTAMACISFYVIVLILVMRQVASPVEKLKLWAKQLNGDKLRSPSPDFKFSELNELADIVKTSLSSVQETLDREQRFLGYASHELRTPISVTRTNSELLKKLIEKGQDPNKQLEVVDRIHRAGLTMSNLTETLLWLNRQEDKSLPIRSIELGVLVKEICHEQGYLLKGKPVSISVLCDQFIIELPLALTHIVVTNIVRNAFQHTFTGEVNIIQSKQQLTVVNRCLENRESPDELGFGLGLQLTQRLTKQYGWPYSNTHVDGGREVKITFV